MNQEEERRFEDHLKSIADQHEQTPSPEVWLNVHNSLLRKRARNLTPLWIACGLLATLLVGALSSEFILKPFGIYSAEQKIKTPAASHVNSSASVPKENKSQLNSSSSPGSTSSTNSLNLNKDSTIPQKQKPMLIESAQKKQVTSNFYFQPKKITSSSSIISGSNDESPENNSAMKAENSNQFNAISSDFPENKNSTYNEQNVSISSSAFLPEKRIFPDDQALNAAQHREQKIGMVLPVKSKPLNATIEADFIPLMNYSWNTFPTTKYFEIQQGDTLSYNRPNTNSFHYKGFSSGINFYYHLHSITFIGAGLHFTELKTSIHYPTYGYFINPLGPGSSNSLLVTETTKWLDLSFMLGASLFPHSKNHLQLIGGAALSHIFSGYAGNSDESLSPAGWNGIFYEEPFFMSKNQLQLFGEVGYLRDFGKHFGVSIGTQFHCYPLDLQAGKNVTQHQFWLGIKLGIDYTIPAKK